MPDLEETKEFVRRMVPTASEQDVESAAKKIVKAFSKYKVKAGE